MDELREVKLEDESGEDVGIQMTNDAPDVSIPKYTIVGTLKRKRVVSSEYANLNFAPSKNSQIFENPPKLEPLDDDSNSSFAPKPEPEEEEQGGFFSLTSFLEPPPKLEPMDVLWKEVQESSSNLAPFFENLLENHVKQEEEPYYPTSWQGASLSSNFPPREPKEEPPEECVYQQQGSSFLNLPPILEMSVKEEEEEEPLPKYTIWDRQTSEQESFSNSAPFRGNHMEKDAKLESIDEEEVRSLRGLVPFREQRGPSKGLEGSSGSSWAPVKEEEEPTGPQTSCCFCGRLPLLANVHLKSELLILAVGLTLAGKLTVQRAQELCLAHRTESVAACQQHYAEAAVAIQRASDVEAVVHDISPHVPMEWFRARFEEFHRKHTGEQIIGREREISKVDRCELCDRHQQAHELCEVDYRASKYLLAVASVLHAYRTPTQAMLFASGGVTARRVCATHIRSTVDVILERLKISSSDEQPRIDDVMDLMSVVNGIWENCTAPVFMNTFRWFAETKHVVKPVMTPPPTKPIPQVLLPIAPEPRQQQPQQPQLPFLPDNHCAVCHKKYPFARAVTKKNTRLVLVVGACLSMRMGLFAAKKIMAGDATRAVCLSHFGSTLRCILEYLRIESLDETPAPELARRVTSLARTFCSSSNRIGYEGFVGIVAAFAEEYADLIDSSPPPSTATTPNASMNPRFLNLE